MEAGESRGNVQMSRQNEFLKAYVVRLQSQLDDFLGSHPLPSTSSGPGNLITYSLSQLSSIHAFILFTV